MKKLLTFLPALALCVILSGCGSLGNINQIANTLGIPALTIPDPTDATIMGMGYLLENPDLFSAIQHNALNA